MKIIKFLILICLLANPVLGQDIYVGISAYGRQQMDIAVLPFLSSREMESTAEQMTEILNYDLNYSLYFSLLEDFELPGYSDVFTLKWDKLNQLGAEAIIACKISSTREGLELNALIVDPYSESVLFQRSYSGPTDKYRNLVHQLSDDVVEVLTGESGIFTSRIAYVRKGGQTSSIRICDYDGYEDQVYASKNTLNLSPFWDKSDQVYFTSYYSGKPDIVKSTSDGFTPVAANGNLNIGGEISPQGDYIAYACNIDGNTDIYIKSLSSGEIRRLTFSAAIDCSPTWAPSGMQLAFTSDRGGSPQIYLVNVDGSGIRLLTTAGGYNTSPAWSPRGDRIVFVGNYEGLFQLFSISPTGDNLRQLTSMGQNEDPSWSADGLHLVFSSNRTGTYKLYTMNFDGTSIRELISSPGSIMPSWSF
ncbi:MAG: hypothetical protein APR63_01585 [Desulfuromonas sp. SDB]|nr:MAG: hypothetical protein APR63_01585 [Desulfuromonas sp. SDB]